MLGALFENTENFRSSGDVSLLCRILCPHKEQTHFKHSRKSQEKTVVVIGSIGWAAESVFLELPFYIWLQGDTSGIF